MGDFGIKISGIGENVNTSTIDESYFDSRYSSLILLDKQTLSFTANQGDTDPFGTETYTHNYGYAPFVLAYADITSGQETWTDNMIPYNWTGGVPRPNPGNFMSIYLGATVDTSDIDITWAVSEFLPGIGYPLSQDCDFTVILHIYAFELGYET